MRTDLAPWLTTVNGPLAAAGAGVTDAHQHVWIRRIPGVSADAPALENQVVAEEGLTKYRLAGGGVLLDCQPDGCGRDAAMLRRLSQTSGVPIVACTGFHLVKYYPPEHWLWSASEAEAGDYFIRELQDGVSESPADGAIRAGFIKLACTADLTQTPGPLFAAAAMASALTGAALMVHTEQGLLAEEIFEWLTRLGASAERIVLCHVDKRPDLGLHKSLADAGALLEYDTFFRPKYDPERNVWPLIEGMVDQGYARSVAVGTDLADVANWRKPGPAGLPEILMPRLRAMGCSIEIVASLTGGNIVARLASTAQSL